MSGSVLTDSPDYLYFDEIMVDVAAGPEPAVDGGDVAGTKQRDKGTKGNPSRDRKGADVTEGTKHRPAITRENGARPGRTLDRRGLEPPDQIGKRARSCLSTSGLILMSTAPTLQASCCGLVAPVMTLVTSGR